MIGFLTGGRSSLRSAAPRPGFQTAADRRWSRGLTVHRGQRRSHLPFRCRELAFCPAGLTFASLGISMRLGTPMRVLLVVAASSVIAGVCGILILRLMFSRTREFRAQAHLGQPIVRAIEEYRKRTGVYPESLADLAPKYLPTVPDLPDESNNKFGGWNYCTVTNGAIVSYSLRYYMGRGGVEYEPPKWIGNNEGHRTVILSNE
jgi:hypothetical protein